MASPAPQLLQSHSAEKTTVVSGRPLSTLIDISSKGVAALAIALYASGFLIVSLHDSRFGFTETNPFRPKILAAGAWFFIFTAIPVATMAAMEKNWFSWRRFAQYLFPYYIGCVTFAIPASWLFNSVSTVTKPINWWWTAIEFILFMTVFFVTHLKKGPPILLMLASILGTVYSVGTDLDQVITYHNFDVSTIALWFFGVGVMTATELNVRLKNLADSPAWKLTKTLIPILVVLVIFALYYYPRMKVSWGGGSPINVILYFNKDSAIKPNQNVSVQLVDESDAGFYIVGQNESRAIFVPRSSVSLVYFSDKPSDSMLLK